MMRAGLSRRAFAAGLLGLGAEPAFAAETREIALTFDDAPTPDSAALTGEQRTRRLIAALKRARVSGAAIFAIGEQAHGQGLARLRAYARAGHVIGNHTNTHRSANRLSTEEFLADVRQADDTLSGLPRFRRWMRFPYLDEGDAVAKRDAVRAGLREMGYANGYVTVDPWDWCMDYLVRDAVARGDAIDWAIIAEVYADVIVRSANFMDTLARRRLGRAPRQVLLLHENDLAVRCIGRAAARLRAEGWRIIPADQAFADPIAAIEPETLPLNSGRLAALARIAGASAAEVDTGFRNEARLAELLSRGMTPRAG
ncbi:MAG: polysaccharide deacetylase family protein [Hyphomonadaceae bacterium]|nr:polysaccharide deacetylase family protein [Hyphomonadaceae bacterium]